MNSYVVGIHVYLEDETKLDEMKVEMVGPGMIFFTLFTINYKISTIYDEYLIQMILHTLMVFSI